MMLAAVGDAGTWILWLLIALSVFAVATIIERSLLFRAVVPPLKKALAETEAQLAAGIDSDWQPSGFGPLDAVVCQLCVVDLSIETRLSRFSYAVGHLRRQLMQRAGILGTLGANTPFIGLLGTVFGIIRAFQELALTAGKGADSIMAGIAEALVATGTGLLIAIPCVLAYNYFARSSQALVEELSDLGSWLVAEVDNKHRSGES